MLERRSEPRLRLSQKAKILVDGGGVIDCQLVDRSSAGARIAVASPFGIPEEFVLVFLFGMERRPARVAWRRLTPEGAELGLDLFG